MIEMRPNDDVKEKFHHSTIWEWMAKAKVLKVGRKNWHYIIHPCKIVICAMMYSIVDSLPLTCPYSTV